MGTKVFGNLVRNSNGIVTFVLSPFRQRAFAGFFTKSASNMARRSVEGFASAGPGLLFGAFLFKWALDDFDQRQRKNPADFANDS